ncbi:MAG: fibronectin type III domain-containing protein, partial [Kiritimatiellae bacterium]|nr:fibronectin type III domain-containing protein [Kiritimatiellia bacterium]
MHLTTTGGALTDAKALARWDTLASFIKNDIQADINRWRPDVPWDQAKIRSRLPGRAAAAFAAFEDAGYIVAPGGIPAAPSSLAAAATSSTKITLTWQDNSSNETAFKIERSSSGSSGWVQIATTGANQTTYADSGLAAASTYYYRVRASNAAGNSAYSAVAGASTSETVPAVPSSLAAAADSSTKITLTWQDNSSNETAFKIERSSSGS